MFDGAIFGRFPQNVSLAKKKEKRKKWGKKGKEKRGNLGIQIKDFFLPVSHAFWSHERWDMSSSLLRLNHHSATPSVHLCFLALHSPQPFSPHHQPLPVKIALHPPQPFHPHHHPIPLSLHSILLSLSLRSILPVSLHSILLSLFLHSILLFLFPCAPSS